MPYQGILVPWTPLIVSSIPENTQEDADDVSKGLTTDERLGNLFFNLYKGLDRAYGQFTISNANAEEGEKVKGRAFTEVGEYSVKLWNVHLKGEQGLGVIPIQDDGTCWWGAIDVDVYPLDIKLLEQRVRDMGLPLVVIRTKSGGAHLTLFLSEPVSCKLVRNRLYEFAMALGYGGVEIFPKQVQLASNKDVGNWLNMPYFDHRRTSRYAYFKGQRLDAEQFLSIAFQLRIDEEQLRSVEVQLSGDFEDGPPCLQMMCKQGIPEGTRNNTLFAMGVYAKMKFEDDWEVKLEEMNRAYLPNPLASKEVQAIIKSAGRKDYFYPCNKSPLNQFCNRDLCRKRQFGIGQGGDEFSLNLGALLKIATEPPLWIIDIEGVRVQLDTEDLMMQDRFRRACMMSVNKLPPMMKRNEWEKIVREKLETVETVDAPIESKQSSRINQYVQEFIMRTPPARVRDELIVGRHWYDEKTDEIWFRGIDLLQFLDRHGIKTEVRRVWSSVRDYGMKNREILVRGAPVQLWCIPKASVPNVSLLDLPPEPEGEF